MNSKKIVLVGGAGFIGHNLALALNKYGAEVTVVDGLQVNNLIGFLSSDTPAANRELYLNILGERQKLIRERGIQMLIHDARDYHALCKVIDSVKPEVVIHLAAVSHANQSNKNPYNTFDHSLRTLENALDASRGIAEHFIYLSSSMVYGHFKNLMVTENDICDPLGIYAALKYGGEKLVIAYKQVFDLDYTIIRPSALYGERCVSRRVGQIFIENALMGNDIDVTGDGSDKLDFTYIEDFVEGMIGVISSRVARNQIFNLTYGEARSLATLAEILQQQFPSINVKYHPKDDLTPDRGTLSVKKARELLQYSPKYPLEVGYLKYINWYKEYWSRTNSSG